MTNLFCKKCRVGRLSRRDRRTVADHLSSAIDFFYDSIDLIQDATEEETHAAFHPSRWDEVAESINQLIYSMRKVRRAARRKATAGYRKLNREEEARH